MTMAMALLLDSLVIAALGAPRLIYQSVAKMPSLVPKEWVADYNADDQ
jgi:hypothetical protein